GVQGGRRQQDCAHADREPAHVALARLGDARPQIHHFALALVVSPRTNESWRFIPNASMLKITDFRLINATFMRPSVWPVTTRYCALVVRSRMTAIEL